MIKNLLTDIVNRLKLLTNSGSPGRFQLIVRISPPIPAVVAAPVGKVKIWTGCDHTV